MVLAGSLAACSDNDTPRSPPRSSPPPPAISSTSDIAIADSQPGATPFISFVTLRGVYLDELTSVDYVIEPKPGTVSKPVAVQFSVEALKKRTYMTARSGVATLPIFGLYADYYNDVQLKLTFKDGSLQNLSTEILTGPYADPTGIYGTQTILTPRVAGSPLDFDFFVMKSTVGTPVVMDTDGNMRWATTGVSSANSTIFQDNAFFIGAADSKKLQRIELDGSSRTTEVISQSYYQFHHNIDPGKQGLLIEVDAIINGETHIESILAEISPSGVVLKEWDLAALFSDYMRSQGDDPSQFVRPGVDWFHMNGATYDARDDSLIVSSRESFIVKLDYSSGNILWLFGDPSKYWYTFPSLQAKALTLTGDGLYPIGQHAPSISSDGLLMVFNNGFASLNHPSGTSAGENRAYSVVSTYSIDATKREAREVRSFDYDQSIYSPICSSAYEASSTSMLVNYSSAEGHTKARMVGLDAGRNVRFDFEYTAPTCSASWNATPIRFEALQFN